MLAVADNIWQTLIVTIGTLLIAYMQLKNTGKLNGLKTTADAIHGLVNSRMTSQMDLVRLLAKRVASITKDPADQQIADAAQKAYDEQFAAQQISQQATVSNK